MNQQQAARVVGLLTAAFLGAGQKFSDAQMQVWFDHLRDLDYEQTLQQAEGWIESESRFPTIADIRGRVIEFRTARAKALRSGAREPDGPELTPEQTAINLARMTELRAEFDALNTKMVARTEAATAPIPPYQPTSFLRGCQKEDHTDCGWDASGEIPLRAERDRRARVKARSEATKRAKSDPWKLGRDYAQAE